MGGLFGSWQSNDLRSLGWFEVKGLKRQSGVELDRRKRKLIAVSRVIYVAGGSNQILPWNDRKVKFFEKGLSFTGNELKANISFFTQSKRTVLANGKGFGEITTAPKELEGQAKAIFAYVLANFNLVFFYVVNPKCRFVVNQFALFRVKVLKAHAGGLTEEKTSALSQNTA